MTIICAHELMEVMERLSGKLSVYNNMLLVSIKGCSAYIAVLQGNK